MFSVCGSVLWKKRLLVAKTKKKCCGKYKKKDKFCKKCPEAEDCKKCSDSDSDSCGSKKKK